MADHKLDTEEFEAKKAAKIAAKLKPIDEARIDSLEKRIEKLEGKTEKETK